MSRCRRRYLHWFLIFRTVTDLITKEERGEFGVLEENEIKEERED